MERSYIMTLQCTEFTRTMQRILGIIARRRMAVAGCNFSEAGRNDEHQCVITISASPGEMENLSRMVAKQVEVRQVKYAFKSEAGRTAAFFEPKSLGPFSADRNCVPGVSCGEDHYGGQAVRS